MLSHDRREQGPERRTEQEAAICQQVPVTCRRSA